MRKETAKAGIRKINGWVEIDDGALRIIFAAKPSAI